jgi:hypothetical protein
MNISIYAHIRLREPQFSALTLLMALTSKVSLHGFVNLNFSVFFEIVLKLRNFFNRTMTSAKNKNLFS